MVTHILKLIKAQFRSNSWVLAELLVVFVVMWFMADYFLMQGVLMNRPVGFKLDNVYQAVVSLRPAESPSFIQYEEGSEEPLQNFERIIERIGRHPDVEVVGLSYYSLPYTFSNMGDGIRRDSIRLNVRNMMVSPDYLQVFGIHSAEGESPEEMARKLSELVSTKDLMISGELARSLFDRTDILGKEVYMSGDSIPKRIVVVTEPVRNDEYDAGDMNVFFTRMDLTAMQREWGMKESDFTDVQVTFRTRPGSTLPDYAQHFLKEMKLQLKAGNFWVSDIKRFENIRADFLANSKETNNRKLFSALGVFFLVNVFLAVIGTFWFRVNRRRSELGLRMAVGSTRSGIQTLMIGEGVVLLTLAALPALLVWMDLLSATVMPAGTLRFLVVSLITWATLALTIILATWYPSRKASHLEPAEALHYE